MVCMMVWRIPLPHIGPQARQYPSEGDELNVLRDRGVDAEAGRGEWSRTVLAGPRLETIMRHSVAQRARIAV